MAEIGEWNNFKISPNQTTTTKKIKQKWTEQEHNDTNVYIKLP